MVEGQVERIPQLRVAMNSRCGRACFYCRPSGEAVATRPGAAIPQDDLLFFLSIAADLGLTSVKFTGGDPALYDGLEKIVGDVKQATKVERIEVISRHPAIGRQARKLAAAGVDVFNVSLDTLDPTLHKRITGIGDHGALIDAIGELVATQVPVKLNTVFMEGINDTEILNLIDFSQEMGVGSLKILDVVEDLDSGNEFNSRRLLRVANAPSLRHLYAPLDHVRKHLESICIGHSVRNQGGLGHPMSVYTLRHGLEVILKDASAGAWYGSICRSCRHYPCHDALMALRLTADLRLQYCLLRDDITEDVAEMIKQRNSEQLKLTMGRALKIYQGATFSEQIREDRTGR